MTLTRMLTTCILASSLALSACGGGGGVGVASTGSHGGIGGTGITSTGTVDGFGSIFVNGVEFETGEADVFTDGQILTEAALKLGMVVVVNGTINDDGITGNAQAIVIDNEVRGPITSIKSGLDGDSLLLAILGIEVIAERVGTVFEHVSFDTLAVGDVVEVSGFRLSGSQFRATRIEKTSNFVPGSSEVELKGTVSNLAGTTFNLDAVVVDYSHADLSDVPGGSLAEGMQVEVHGTLANNIIQADRIEQEDDLASHFDDQEEVSVQGAITQLVDQGHFVVNGVAVDASHASLEPAGLVLADGVIVQVEGRWNGSVLVAAEVHSRRGRIELEAKVASVNTAEGTVTLHYVAGTVTVQVDSTTLLDDDLGQADPLTLGAIASGDFLEVEAIREGDALVASRIHRDEPDDNVLQAPVESFDAGVGITLLGIAFSTVGAEFENQQDDVIDPATFYGQLQVGDLVKVKDEQQPDGVADEVEFEQEDALDGEEFDDDADGDCDEDVNVSGDDCDAEEEPEPDDSCDTGDDNADGCVADDGDDSEIDEPEEDEPEEEEPEEEEPEEVDPEDNV